MGHLVSAVFFIFIYFTGCYSHSVPSRKHPVGYNDFDLAPEDLAVKQGLRYVAKNPQIIRDLLTKVLTPTDLDKAKAKLPLLWSAKALDENNTQPLECIACKYIIEAVEYISTYPFFLVEPLIRTACPPLLTVIGWPPELMCETIIDNWARPVYDIGKGNIYGSEGACIMLNFCEDQQLLKDNDGKLANTINSKQKSLKGVNGQTRDPDWKKNAFVIAHHADIHLDKNYLTGSMVDCNLPLCCHGDYPGNGMVTAGPFGQYNCNVPPSTVQMFIKFLAGFDADVVINTGDNPPHHLWLEVLDQHMNVTTWVANAIIEANPGKPVYSTLGNHDNFPTNLYYVKSENTQAVHGTFIAAYRDVSGWGEEQVATFSRGGYYSVLIQEGLRLISYNSNFGYTNNWYNLLNYQEPDPQEMIQWIEEQLKGAREKQEKVFIITHHPVGEGIVEFDRSISHLVTEYADIIKFNLAGHKHKETWRLFHGDDGKAKSVQFLSQSSNSYITVNPGARVYYFDRDTLELLDYEQYTLDITDGASASIEFSYQATKEYELVDLSVASMEELTNRMSEDQELFEKYYNHRRSGAPPHDPCVDSCRVGSICSLLTTDMDSWRQCASTGQIYF